MITELPFQKFLDLVAFDKLTVMMERDVELLDKEINEFQNEIFRHEDALEHAKTLVTSCKKRVDEKELEMKDLDAKIKSKQELFDRVVNSKEYKSAQQEIDSLKKKQFDLEELLLSAWNELESINRSYIETKTRLEKRIVELEDLISSSVQRKKDLAQKITQRAPQRSELESGIPEEWLEKYSSMRKSVSNPVVPVINNACSACFYSLTQQDIARLKRNALLQCKECYRFLYME